MPTNKWNPVVLDVEHGGTGVSTASGIAELTTRNSKFAESIGTNLEHPQIGDLDSPVYVNSDGKITEATSVKTNIAANATAITNIVNGTTTIGNSTDSEFAQKIGTKASPSNVGNASTPVYISNGVFVEANSTTETEWAQKIGTKTSHPAIGSTTTPVYVDDSGTITAASGIRQEVTANATAITLLNSASTVEGSVDYKIKTQGKNAIYSSTLDPTTGAVTSTVTIGEALADVIANTTGITVNGQSQDVATHNISVDATQIDTTIDSPSGSGVLNVNQAITQEISRATTAEGTLTTNLNALTQTVATNKLDYEAKDAATNVRIDNLIEDAPEAFDTLKEIADYISSHTTEFDALSALVTQSKLHFETGADTVFHSRYADKIFNYTARELYSPDGVNFYSDIELLTPVTLNTSEVTVNAGGTKYIGMTPKGTTIGNTNTPVYVATDGSIVPATGIVTTVESLSNSVTTLNGDVSVSGSVLKSIYDNSRNALYKTELDAQTGEVISTITIRQGLDNITNGTTEVNKAKNATDASYAVKIGKSTIADNHIGDTNTPVYVSAEGIVTPASGIVASVSTNATNIASNTTAISTLRSDVGDGTLVARNATYADKVNTSTAIGGEYQPIYINANGEFVTGASTQDVQYASKIGSSASHPQIGAIDSPVYISSDGTVTEATSVKTNITANATEINKIKLGKTTVKASEYATKLGSVAVNAETGVVTESTVTVGNIDTPVFINEGVPVIASGIVTTVANNQSNIANITNGTTRVGKSQDSNYATKIGNSTAENGIVAIGSTTNPVYVNSLGVVTAISNNEGIVKTVSDQGTAIDTLNGDVETEGSVLNSIYETAAEARYGESTTIRSEINALKSVQSDYGHVDTVNGVSVTTGTKNVEIKANNISRANSIENIETSLITIESSISTLNGSAITTGSVLNSVRENADNATHGSTTIGNAIDTVTTNFNNLTVNGNSINTSNDSITVDANDISVTVNNTASDVQTEIQSNRTKLDTLQGTVSTNGSVLNLIHENAINAAYSDGVTLGEAIDNVGADTLQSATDYTDSQIEELVTDKLGVADGIATLDSTGHIPSSQLAINVMEYKGSFDASSGSYPAVGTTSIGDYYIVTVGGTISGDTLVIGDRIIYNGTGWDIIHSGEDNAVTSVNTMTGDIILTASNLVRSTTNDQTVQTALTSAETRLTTAESGITTINNKLDLLDEDESVTGSIRYLINTYAPDATAIYWYRFSDEVPSDLSSSYFRLPRGSQIGYALPVYAVQSTNVQDNTYINTSDEVTPYSGTVEISELTLDGAIVTNSNWISSIESQLSSSTGTLSTRVTNIENGTTVVPNATDSVYAVKIGTSSSHPAIGDTSNPVYINANGEFTTATQVRTDIDSNTSAISNIVNGTTTVPNATYATRIGTSIAANPIGSVSKPVYVNANGEITEIGINEGIVRDVHDVIDTVADITDGTTAVPRAADAVYATKIGTSSSHPAIGDQYHHIYINSSGEFVASTYTTDTTTVRFTATDTYQGVFNTLVNYLPTVGAEISITTGRFGIYALSRVGRTSNTTFALYKYQTGAGGTEYININSDDTAALDAVMEFTFLAESVVSDS